MELDQYIGLAHADISAHSPCCDCHMLPSCPSMLFVCEAAGWGLRVERQQLCLVWDSSGFPEHSRLRWLGIVNSEVNIETLSSQCLLAGVNGCLLALWLIGNGFMLDPDSHPVHAGIGTTYMCIDRIERWGGGKFSYWNSYIILKWLNCQDTDKSSKVSSFATHQHWKYL